MINEYLLIMQMAVGPKRDPGTGDSAIRPMTRSMSPEFSYSFASFSIVCEQVINLFNKRGNTLNCESYVWALHFFFLFLKGKRVANKYSASLIKRWNDYTHFYKLIFSFTYPDIYFYVSNVFFVHFQLRLITISLEMKPSKETYLFCHNVTELLEAGDGRQATESAVLGVSRQTMVTSTLDVHSQHI